MTASVIVPPDLEEADPLLVERLASRLSEALGSGIDIDCRSASSLPLALQGRIITEGVMIYEGDAVERVRFGGAWTIWTRSESCGSCTARP